MYRIKNDKRILGSAKKLTDGLFRLMKTKPFNDISVSDIVRESGACRATFYRIFDTPTDLLSYACESHAKEILEKLKEDKGRMSRDEFLRFILTSWIDQAEIIEAIMRSGRPLVLHNALGIIFREVISFGDQFTENEKDYLQSSLTAQFESILFVWIRHGKSDSVNYLLKLFKRFAETASKRH